MKSQIKIDFRDTEKGLQPVIAIKMEDSDDVKDGLLKTFFQKLGGNSSWLNVSFDHHIEGAEGGRSYITLTPVASNDLPKLKQTVEERLFLGAEKTNYNPLHDTARNTD